MQSIGSHMQDFRSHDLGKIKTDDEAFSDVCSRLHVQPARVVFADDNISNIASAQKAGIQKTILVTSIDQLEQELANIIG